MVRRPGNVRLSTPQGEVVIPLENRSKNFEKPRLAMHLLPLGQRLRPGARNPLLWSHVPDHAESEAEAGSNSDIPPGIVGLMLERFRGAEVQISDDQE